MDPSVRDDGDPEPDLQLASDSATNAVASDDSVRQAASSESSQSVRDRLVAKAHGARRDLEPELPVRGGLDEVGRTEARGALDGELDALGTTGRAPAEARAPRGRTQLSPTLIAVFGTLIGVATVLSIIALVINVDRHRAPNPATSAPAQSASAAPVASAPIHKAARQKVPGPWRISDEKADRGTLLIEGKVGADPFIKALTTAGIEAREAYRLITALKGVRDFDKCAKSDRFSALIERGSSRVKAFEYIVGPEEIYQAREGDGGLLKGSKLDLKVEHNQVTGAVIYDGHDFDASAERAGFDVGLGHVVALALQGHMAMDELEGGDTIRLLGQEVTVLGEFARYTGIEAIEVRHANVKKNALRVYYFDDPTLRGYYDSSGKSPYEGGFRKPISGAPVTSPFNPRRMHPILHKIMPHLGTDIGAPMGTPVGASAPGTVSFVGPGGPAGNLLKIMHPNGIETGYAHLSRYVEGIKVGDKLKRMQIIGYVGSTGRSTGPHLHFSAERDGKFFDAESLNLDGMRVLNKDQRERFSAVIAKYNPLLDAIALPNPAPGVIAESSSASPSASGAAEDPGLAEAASEVDEPSAKPSDSAAGPPLGASQGPSTSVYMSDKELLKAQSATDEGEVSE